MANANFSAAAQDDIVSIWQFIKRQSGSDVVADKFVAKIKSVALDQAALPFSGHPRFDLMPDLRACIVGRYILFYLPEISGITVIRVIQGSRDIRRAFHSE